MTSSVFPDIIIPSSPMHSFIYLSLTKKSAFSKWSLEKRVIIAAQYFFETKYHLVFFYATMKKWFLLNFSVDQFTCANGKCIPNNWKCDGNNDCGDKSDESDLRCNKLNCRPTEFKCLDEEKCIPEKWRCDFDQDCRDGSDENCTHATCPADQFR